MVCGHGLGTDQSIWDRLAPTFAHDHRVVLLDWVGCGAADPDAFDSTRYATLRGHAADLCDVLDALALTHVTYVGHSAGGMIGVLAAIARPDLFERLVLLAASPRYIDDLPHYVGGSRPEDVEALFTLMDANFVGWSHTFAAIAARDADVEHELVELFRHNDRRFLREFAASVLYSDFRSDLDLLHVPTLVLGASRDDMVPVVVSEYLHAHINGSAYVCLDIPGHCPQMTHPRDVETAIRTFVASTTS